MNRLDRLRARMEATGTDLVALAPGAHMRWLLGFMPHPDERACLLLVGLDQAGFVMPALNAGDVRQHTELPFWEWHDADGPGKALGTGLEAVGSRPRRIALDEAMRADHALMVLDDLPNVAHAFANDTLGALRMVKDADELAALKENALIADLAQTALRGAIRDGTTEHALAEVAKDVFERHQARTAFSIVGAGVNSSYPHHHTGDTVVRPGQAIVVDIGGYKDGYYSDITRMACLDEPPEGYAEVHSIVDAAVIAALDAIRPGVECRAVDTAARDVIAAAGYGEYFTHRTGHGLGSEVHEPPYISASNPLMLEEGMVFTVEPGIYLPGRFGIRLEEVAVVTDKGCQILSELPRTLHVA
ncbi:Xaa-Pro peptidase family protein [Cognatiyoonia sp. IB215446]|uniref:M24 family metallopeptidase n=1 Tax=Cognatiyoonia sp. IB215446 TaxID=3097355 RepID=UPI002A0B13AC|nr:Xaa-Pro peptidase family protein [Cognatiyoonia sp. IB215446]MDX8348116.1 Xaa-Pro peptidase family protein [Cognatiyoonia sp. IB215446]